MDPLEGRGYRNMEPSEGKMERTQRLKKYLNVTPTDSRKRSHLGPKGELRLVTQRSHVARSRMP